MPTEEAERTTRSSGSFWERGEKQNKQDILKKKERPAKGSVDEASVLVPEENLVPMAMTRHLVGSDSPRDPHPSDPFPFSLFLIFFALRVNLLINN